MTERQSCKTERGVIGFKAVNQTGSFKNSNKIQIEHEVIALLFLKAAGEWQQWDSATNHQTQHLDQREIESSPKAKHFITAEKKKRKRNRKKSRSAVKPARICCSICNSIVCCRGLH